MYCHNRTIESIEVSVNITVRYYCQIQTRCVVSNTTLAKQLSHIQGTPVGGNDSHMFIRLPSFHAGVLIEQLYNRTSKAWCAHGGTSACLSMTLMHYKRGSQGVGAAPRADRRQCRRQGPLYNVLMLAMSIP